MESCLEIGFTACITIVVANRTSVYEFNKNKPDWFAYSLAWLTILSLILAPVYLLIMAIKVHHSAKVS